MSRILGLFLFCFFWSFACGAQLLVYTGTFDPPHQGHRNVLTQAMEMVDARQAFVNPGPTDHKPSASPLELRMQMTEQAFLDIPRVEIPPLEVSEAFWDREDNRAIERLKALFPGEEIFRVVGTDRLAWETAETIREAPYKFLVSIRTADSELPEELRPLLNRRIFILPPPELTISSTLMRQQIAENIRPTYLDREVFTTYVRHRARRASQCRLVFQ